MIQADREKVRERLMVRYIQKKEHTVSDGKSEAEVKEVYRERQRQRDREIEREREREREGERKRQKTERERGRERERERKRWREKEVRNKCTKSLSNKKVKISRTSRRGK